LAILDAVERFWLNPTAKDALQKVGLVKSEKRDRQTARRNRTKTAAKLTNQDTEGATLNTESEASMLKRRTKARACRNEHWLKAYAVKKPESSVSTPL
jgi:hypothetical protein